MRVLIVGDVWPQTVPRERMLQRLGIRRSDALDLFIWTLDAAIAGQVARPGRTILTYDPAALEEMRIGVENIVVMASNHISDTGTEGLEEAIQNVTRLGFRHVGAGLNEKQATTPLFCETPAGTIAVLAFAETEPWVGAIAAQNLNAGVWQYEEDACVDAISEASKIAQHVWVCLHWGHEHVRFPEPRQRRAAKRFAEAGATLVVASHTHVPLGRERFGHTDVFYGLGNFIFPNMITENGYKHRWDWISRTGLALDGALEHSSWSWTVRKIRMDRQGVPKMGPVANDQLCPDYSAGRHLDLDSYARSYATIKRAEQRRYLLRRLACMTLQERVFRIRQLFKL